MSHVYPQLSEALATERLLEMLADAKQQRPARRLLAFRRAERRAGRAERRLRRARHCAARLRAELEP